MENKIIIIGWFFTIGIIYIISGLVNYQKEHIDNMYFRVWGSKPPTPKMKINLGVQMIICEILLDTIFTLGIFK